MLRQIHVYLIHYSGGLQMMESWRRIQKLVSFSLLQTVKNCVFWQQKTGTSPLARDMTPETKGE